ncbi:hypothetical protein [Nocardia amikacinitolerans]|uniref:hypothetical protein n=1 Tax=Nocardia amikacinitolerans TaxID=756689 RepID=UPI0020A40DF8|nr:hypothetical protein [Nocardia amikacinitolerans]MCP2276280.1 protein of unknown function (DUF364) [Nocardia amikacinitolerans]MCP2300186.1 protein of unknown function (DUF364) [Nocardia amikacinitolerans]
MTTTDLTVLPRPRSVGELTDLARKGRLGADPADLAVATAFHTRYGTRHAGRHGGYRNEVLSIRVGAAVGSCGLEPGDDSAHADMLDDCVGATVAQLLDHPLAAIRIAVLDAYLMHSWPHPAAAGVAAESVGLTGGSSLEKSRQRAEAVVDLLPSDVRRVLVVGVVGSLLAALRARGIGYYPCDLLGGRTEWDEPVHRNVADAPSDYDAMLVTGMTLGNQTFDALLSQANARTIPLVLFAQTGSAVLPWFLGRGVTAISAEPYPFFSLDGGPSTLYRYRDGGLPCTR